MWWPRPPVSFTSCVKHRTRVSELKQHRNEPYLLATLNIAILWKQGSSHLQHYATYHQGNKCTQRHKWPPKGMFCRSEPLPCSSVLFPSLSLLFTLILLSWIGERFRHLHCFFFKESLCLIHDMKAVRCGWNNFYCPLHHSWRNVMCCFVVVALLKSFSLLSQTFLVVCTFNPVLFCFNRCRPRVQSHKRLVDLFFFFFFLVSGDQNWFIWKVVGSDNFGCFPFVSVLQGRRPTRSWDELQTRILPRRKNNEVCLNNSTWTGA